MKIKTTLSDKQIKDFNDVVRKYGGGEFDSLLIGGAGCGIRRNLNDVYGEEITCRDLKDAADLMSYEMESDDGSWVGQAFGDVQWGKVTVNKLRKEIEGICKLGDGGLREVDVTP